METIVFGLCLRLFAVFGSETCRLEPSWEALLVGGEQRFTTIVECWFRRSHGLRLENMQCTYPTGELLLHPLLSLTAGTVPPPVVLGLVGLLAQLGVCVLLRWYEKHTGVEGYSWTIYWLNPALVISLAASPLPSINHLLLSCLWASVAAFPPAYIVDSLSAQRKRLLKVCLSFFCLVWLVLTHFPFVCLVPSWLALSRRQLFNSTSSVTCWTDCESTAVFAVAFYWIIHGLGEPHTLPFAWSGLSLSSTRAGLTYTPGAGVHWYLNAQIDPFLSPYFELLGLAQPFLFVLPMLLLVAPRDPVLALHVTVAVVVAGAPKTNFTDVLWIISLLALHPRVTRRMRPWLCAIVALCMTVPAVASPALLSLWLELGTGNANFLFFQGLAMWMAGNAGIAEFIASAKEQDKDIE